MLSDTLEVGYTYPWVTPPEEIYQLVNFTSYSGAELIYNGQFLNQDLRASVFYGGITITTTAAGLTGTYEVKQIIAAYFNYGNPDIQLRVGYAEGYLESVTPTPPIVPIIEAYATIYGEPDVISDYAYQSIKAHFVDIGLQVNKYNWILLAEAVQQGVNSAGIKTIRGMYGTVGYRINNWTPFVGAASDKTLDKDHRVYQGPLGVALNPTLALINTDQKTLMAGLRWDVIPGTDFKIQVNRIRADHGTNGNFNTDPKEAVYLIRGTVDVLF